MRLLTKTTLYFFAALVPLLLCSGIYLYHHFSKELNHRLDQELITEEVQWVQYLRAQATGGTTVYLRTNDILITPVNEEPTYRIFQTTTGPLTEGNQSTAFRQLIHIVSVGNISYLIKLRRSLEQRTVLIKNISRVMLIMFLTFFIITLLLNWLISESIWKPFRRALKKINEAELSKIGSIHFEKTDIMEFNELNTSLNRMTEKINNDYLSIKEFTENAAHEMQTPLAVVQSKLELLLQDKDLKNEAVESIIQSADALTRLSKLNQSLLLLAKIENNQYITDEEISITGVFKKYLKLFNEFIQNKELTVKDEYKDDLTLKLHPFLADTLISNLLGNAVKYNYSGGRISIFVSNNSFQITNTSELYPMDPQQIFKRFNKSDSTLNDSTGLGLAIVKKICDIHNLDIHYKSHNGTHTFTISKK